MSKSKAYYSNISPNQAEANLLAQRLWLSANKLRGHLDAREYKFYFLAIFFYKYINDYWKDCLSGNRGPNIHHKGPIKNLIKKRFIIPDNSTFDDVRNSNKPNNIGQRLNKAFHEIERVNFEVFGGIFSYLDFNDFSTLKDEGSKNILLTSLIKFFEGVNLGPATINNEIVARSFDLLLEKFLQQDGKTGEEYQTPFEISELLARLLNPQKKETIYDPACGSGSLIIRLCQEKEGKNDGSNLYGQELHSGIYSIAKMNLIIHEFDEALIINGDSINYPSFFDKKSETLKKFDIVACNPPFSVKNWRKFDPDYYRFQWGMPPQSKSDYAFIQHMLLSSTDKTGRIGIIVNHGVLFRGGIEAEIRKSFLADDLLEAVIGLPSNLFSYTSLPVAVLLFRKGRPKDSNILFIDATKELVQDKRKNKLTLEGIERIVSVYNKFKNDQSSKASVVLEGFSYICSKAEVADNDYNLSLNRYVHYQKEENKVNIEELKLEIERLDEELNQIRNGIKNNLSKLGL